MYPEQPDFETPYVFSIGNTAGDTPMTEIRDTLIEWVTDYKDVAERNALAETPEESADYLLAILEIKEGQELLEKAKSGVLVELDEDQSWPEHSWQVNHSISLSRLGEQQVHDRMLGLGWDRAIGECKGAGFRRVTVKG